MPSVSTRVLELCIEGNKHMNALDVRSDYYKTAIICQAVNTNLASLLSRQLCAHAMRNRRRLSGVVTLSQWSR